MQRCQAASPGEGQTVEHQGRGEDQDEGAGAAADEAQQAEHRD
jgi:hypothetical protein